MNNKLRWLGKHWEATICVVSWTVIGISTLVWWDELKNDMFFGLFLAIMAMATWLMWSGRSTSPKRIERQRQLDLLYGEAERSTAKKLRTGQDDGFFWKDET